MCTEAGSCLRNVGSSALTAVATATVFVPGWRNRARTMERGEPWWSTYQAAALSFSTLSSARPTWSQPHGRAVAVGDDDGR